MGISHRNIFLQNLAQTSDMPLALEIERAEGLYLYDTEGRAYMDMISGIGVSALGHRHPAILKAIETQSSKYLHTMVYGEFILSPQVQLANLLHQVLPASLDNIYLVNSGAEAVEGAMKLAKRYTGRSEIIACKNAYHGSTQGAASLMDSNYFTGKFRPLLPNIKHIEFNREEDLDSISHDTACVIMETVQAEAGVIEPNEGYLQAVRKKCTETGTLLILDEIQASYGRTGYLFAFQKYGIVPDILLLAKGFGGGLPLGAFISSKNIMSCLMDEPILGHITTFGGNPLCAATAFATLDTIIKDKLWEGVERKSKILLEGLVHKKIIKINHCGLWMAIYLGKFELVLEVVQKCLAAGYLVDWFLFNSHSIRICPPLTIEEDDLRKFVVDFLAVLDGIN